MFKYLLKKENKIENEREYRNINSWTSWFENKVREFLGYSVQTEIKYEHHIIKTHENKYFIKINTSSEYLSDKDFVNILSSFRTITENFCDLFNIDINKLKITILSASPGCFNINLGININIKEFNLLKMPNINLDLTKEIIEFLTKNNIDKYKDKPVNLIKDCITGYMTNTISSDNKKLLYVDIKKSKKAKRTILKTIKKLPNLESVSFNGEILTKSEIDLLI